MRLSDSIQLDGDNGERSEPSYTQAKYKFNKEHVEP